MTTSTSPIVNALRNRVGPAGLPGCMCLVRVAPDGTQGPPMQLTADAADTVVPSLLAHIEEVEAELESLLGHVSLLAVALAVDERKAAADPSILTARANLVCGQLHMHVKTISRIRQSPASDREILSALRVLVLGLAALEAPPGAGVDRQRRDCAALLAMWDDSSWAIVLEGAK